MRFQKKFRLPQLSPTPRVDRLIKRLSFAFSMARMIFFFAFAETVLDLLLIGDILGEYGDPDQGIGFVFDRIKSCLKYKIIPNSFKIDRLAGLHHLVKIGPTRFANGFGQQVEKIIPCNF
mgnify:CR=1 FL=1